MKNSYPLLAFWKRTGIKEFPDLKKEPDFFRDLLYEKMSARLRSAAEKAFDETPVPLEQLPITRECMIEALMEGTFERHISDIIGMKRSQAADMRMRAELAITRNGKTIGEASAEFRASLPERRGGKTFLSENDRLLMKLIYEELQEAIKEIRSECAIPLADSRLPDACYTWGKGSAEEIAERCPAALEIFDVAELPISEHDSRISECALLILQERLKKHLPPDASVRTLRDQLQK